jgi:hypothetical protein
MSKEPVALSKVCPSPDQLEGAAQVAWQWTMYASVNPGWEAVAFCRLVRDANRAV